MVRVTRAYKRVWVDRHGIHTKRGNETVLVEDIKVARPSRFTRPADYHALVTKSKRRTDSDNVESECVTASKIKTMLSVVSSHNFYRYKINIFLKKRRT